MRYRHVLAVRCVRDGPYSGHAATGTDLSYVSPLARAVLTHGPRDMVVVARGEAVILDVR